MPKLKSVAPDGYLRDWLLLGSFAGDPGVLALKPLIPEAKVLPGPGQKQAGNAWMVVTAADRVIDFQTLTKAWPQHTHCCAYAHAYIHSDKEQDAFLSLGSDDGVVAWFNGQRVFAVGGARGNVPDQDRVPVSLRLGWNRVLLKVLQYDGGWSFCARLIGSDHQALPGLSTSLVDPLKGRWPATPKDSLPISMILQAPTPSELLTAGPGQDLSVGILVQNLGEQPLHGVKLSLQPVDGKQRILSVPELLPLQSVALRAEILLEDWARSYLEPLALQASVKAQKKELRPLTGLGSAFVAAAGLSCPRLSPELAEKLQSLRREIAAVPEFPEGNPQLAVALKALTRALLSAEATAVPVELDSAEGCLKRAKEAMAGQAVHLVGHAHIDMNWLWSWPETVQACHDTFSQALRFMQEFPTFRFSQSQASCYAAMQDEEPELFLGIQAAVKAGTWNVVGGMWTEGDTNLSSGEAIARSCLLAQRYFQANLGVRAKVGWLPDNFGHAAQLPQILHLSGMDSFYHSRTGPAAQLYWWEGLDGTRVLAKTGQGYNGQVGPEIRHEPQQLPKGVGEQMFVYGVGDHGGGPTRRDIDAGLSMQASRLFPEVRFSTADEYFERVRPKSEGLHVQKGELGYIFEGCYTNVAGIKQGNRDLENALQTAEALAWAARSLGLAWPKATLEEAWRILTFNQFHDILPGSAIHSSNDDSRAFYARGLQLAHQVRAKSLRAVASRVAVPEAEGIPVLVFNTLAWQRDEVTLAEVVLTEPFSSFRLVDPEGKEIPVQIIRTRDFGADIHVWVQFYARAVPGFGYQCYRLIPQQGAETMKVKEWSDQRLEPMVLPLPKSSEVSLLSRKGFKVKNPFFEVEFDSKDGSIKSLRPLSQGTPGANIFAKGGGNKLGLYLEQPHPMSAWNLDPTAEGPLPVQSTQALEVMQEGPESITFLAQLSWGRSRFRLLTTVHAESPRIDCLLKVDWLERGGPEEVGAMLRALWHLAERPDKFFGDVAYGVLERPSGAERPAQKWVDLPLDAGGLTLFNTGKYGHSLHKGSLRLSLLRSSYDPDGYPDLGHHEIRWGLQFHTGNYQAAGLARLGTSFNVPFECYQLRTQSGSLPARHSFLEIQSDPAFVVTGLKVAEDGKGSIVRGYDSSGKGGEFSVRPAAGLKEARQVNLLEEPVDQVLLAWEDGPVTVSVKPWGIASLRWTDK